jgi:8-oxo-dGTP pyrophosphatase MutT (NUDIX family)
VRLLAHISGATFADGSVADVDLELGPDEAQGDDVFAAMVVLGDGAGRLAAVWSPRRQEWSVPGGWREPGETPRQAAVREVLEETGLVVDPASLEPCGREVFTPVSLHGRWPADGGVLQLYRADVLPGQALASTMDDAVDARWVEMGELAELAGHRFWWPLVAAVASA